MKATEPGMQLRHAVCSVCAGVRVAPTTPDFYCVEGYDIKGDGAAAGDIESPVAVENTIVTTSAASCAATCKATAGCQYFVQKAAACYLKMNLIGGKYGVTGAAKDVVVTCVNGVDSWLTFGSVLEISGVVPAPQEFLPAVIIPGAAGATAGGSGTPGNYFCIKEYGVEAKVLKTVPVTAGDEALIMCAGQCDATTGCMAHATSTMGACQLLSDVQVRGDGVGEGSGIEGEGQGGGGWGGGRAWGRVSTWLLTGSLAAHGCLIETDYV